MIACPKSLAPSLAPDTAWFTLAPDWVCEVLSRSTENLDRGEKLPYYAAHSVHHVWLLDPIDKRLEVYTLTSASRLARDPHLPR
jgi:Uma2 family endonuclease